MTRLIARLALPFSISGASEAAAVAALTDASHAERTRLAAKRGRGRIYKALSEMGVFALSSEANFVMAEIPAEPARIYDALLENGIFLPEVFWNGFMQLPVSLEEENGRYLKVLARLIRGEDG
jgi:histidinol-phosphate/aromatic aminotransferase/cobyric acid decarboxylase-like protein